MEKVVVFVLQYDTCHICIFIKLHLSNDFMNVTVSTIGIIQW
jgi:hypothetical protein